MGLIKQLWESLKQVPAADLNAGFNASQQRPCQLGQCLY